MPERRVDAIGVFEYGKSDVGISAGEAVGVEGGATVVAGVVAFML
jgi:hypothetical protein